MVHKTDMDSYPNTRTQHVFLCQDTSSWSKYLRAWCCGWILTWFQHLHRGDETPPAPDKHKILIGSQGTLLWLVTSPVGFDVYRMKCSFLSRTHTHTVSLLLKNLFGTPENNNNKTLLMATKSSLQPFHHQLIWRWANWIVEGLKEMTIKYKSPAPYQTVYQKFGLGCCGWLPKHLIDHDDWYYPIDHIDFITLIDWDSGVRLISFITLIDLCQDLSTAKIGRDVLQGCPWRFLALRLSLSSVVSGVTSPMHNPLIVGMGVWGVMWV